MSDSAAYRVEFTSSVEITAARGLDADAFARECFRECDFDTLADIAGDPEVDMDVMRLTPERPAAWSLRWKANRIILYWLVVGAVYGIVTVYLGWGYALGVLAGMVAQPLWNWKQRGF